MARRSLVLGACMLLAAIPALAGNGHLLHGVGAVNSSLGGAGASLPDEVIGALDVNPALLTQFDGGEVGLGVETFKDGPRLASEAPLGPGGQEVFGHNTAHAELGLIPAIGISDHPSGSRFAWGFGILGVAGFRTDWPGKPGDPVFSPQPNGYGTLHTDLVITKFPIAGAWQATDRLSLGAELAVYQGKFAVVPYPVAHADCTPLPNGKPNLARCFFASASQQVSAWSATAQIGFYYKINHEWSAGGSWLAPQKYSKYTWNSSVINPDNLATFGQPRSLSEEVDGPQSFVLGLGYTPSARLRLALDARWVNYSNTHGFSGQGFAFDAADGGQPKLLGIGWQNIWIGMLGAEYVVSPRVTLRGGLNFNQSPINSARVFQSLGTPSTYTQHYCLGLGVKATDKLGVNLAVYYVPRNSISGPILSKEMGPGVNPVPNTVFTISDSIVSGLVALSVKF
jgi:long-chain fatty acid transport protein